MTTSTARIFFILLFWAFSTCNINAKQSCTEVNEPQNIQTCTELANRGDAKAQTSLGVIYYSQAVWHKGYHTKARILFEKAAEQGLAEAQYHLGAMYRDELNNFPVALTWFEKAAAQGNLDAINSIGYIYENGSGGKAPRLYVFDENGKNTSPDIANFTGFDGKGHFPVSTYPRSLYPFSEFGQGIEQNYSLAASWYQKAAEQGHALAQTNLAYLYLMGLGVEKDPNQAFALYQKAAAQNFVPALNTLGFLYVQGIGTEVNVKAGFDCLVKAYLLQPTSFIASSTITALKYKEAYQPLHLTANLPRAPEPIYQYRQPFSLDSASEEDCLFDEMFFLPLYYNLNLLDRDAVLFSRVYAYNRSTKESAKGFLSSERQELWISFSIKTAIQGSIRDMLELNSFYSGWEPDMINAHLWKKYVINMGHTDSVEFWGKDD